MTLTLDERPPSEDERLHCAVCGVELEYAGTGRKPTKCDEHKNTRNRPGKPAAASSASSASGNERLAERAADVLCQLNDFAAVGLMVAKLHGTAGALADRAEVFREQAVSALVTDPALCRMILRGGATSGKVMLFAAYASLLMGVAPVAVEELRDIRAERAEGSE